MLDQAAMLRGLAAVLIALAVSPAWAQRVYFPTRVSPDEPAARSLAAMPTQPGGTTRFFGDTATPSATLNGTIQPQPSFDPYADAAPGGQPAYSPYSPSPYGQPPPGYAGTQPALGPQPSIFAPWAEPLRLLQEIRFRYTYLAGDSEPKDFETNDVELSGTFAFPINNNLQAPLLITPGFAVHYLEGPITAPPLFADLPPRVYDAYLDVGWNPQFTPAFGASLGARVGVYSDFQEFNSESIRIMGRGLAIFGLSPTVQLAAGVIYLDRVDIKLLPAGGVVWTPNPDVRYEILFPNPKLSRRFTTWGTTDVWGYVSGELGGGSWNVERVGGVQESFDYDDIRVMLGLEATAQSGFKMMFEIGYVFNRKILYEGSSPHRFEPDDTYMARAGMSY